MTGCERHKRMASLEQQNKTKEEIYQELRWLKCTCNVRLIWCDYCRGSTKCLLCCNRDGKPLNKNHIYCPRCGGTSKCHYCNEKGEMIKG